jgi:tetratricopeptide (TPR) repeat protein
MLGDDAAMLATALRFRELWPDHQFALQLCVWVHLRLGDYAAATRLLDESSELRPQGREGYPGFHFVVALSQLRRLGRAGTPEFAELVKKAEAWFASRPPPEAASKAQRFDRARILYLAGRYPEARVAGEALVREFPDNRAYRGFVGSCAARLGDTKGAQAALTWLRAVDPKYRFGHHVYLQAQITALLGQRDEALQLLRDARAQFAAPVEDVSLIADIAPLHPDFESLANDPDFKALFAPKG